MKRILIWLFVAIFLFAFFCGIVVTSRISADAQVLFFGFVADGIIFLIGWAALFAFVYFWKKRFVAVAGKYGGKVFSRDEQPISYWCGMFYYIIAFCLATAGAWHVFLRDLLPILQKHFNH